MDANEILIIDVECESRPCPSPPPPSPHLTLTLGAEDDDLHSNSLHDESLHLYVHLNSLLDNAACSFGINSQNSAQQLREKNMHKDGGTLRSTAWGSLLLDFVTAASVEQPSDNAVQLWYTTDFNVKTPS